MSDLHNIAFAKNGITFNVAVICFNEYLQFDDDWTRTDDHIGGVTVKNPNADRNSWAYFIPEYSLAERIEGLIASGVSADVASGQAYKDAQQSLLRDIEASDYGFSLTATIGGVTLVRGEIVGCGFGYSYRDDETLEAVAEDVFKENGGAEDCIAAAVAAAKEFCKVTDELNTFIKANEA